MDPRDYSDTPRSTSTQDYAGWAPGTNASERLRPTFRALRDMATSRSQFRRTSADAISPSSQISRSRSSEGRYDVGWQPQMVRTGYQSTSIDIISERPNHHSYGNIGGFASTVVDADGNPIDTGRNAELPNPRSIVYNPPPPPPHRLRGQPSRQSEYNEVSEPHRASDMYHGYDEVTQQVAETDNQTSSTWNDAWARYTHMQRQERFERMERQSRAFLRAERLRRAGASTGDSRNGYVSLSSTEGTRGQPLDELRRDLHRSLYELHRDRHPAYAPTGSHNTTKDNFRHAIQYLSRIRSISGEYMTKAERMRVAHEEGFGHTRNGHDSFDRNDFIMDPAVLDRVPETSWLLPGTTFTGRQCATNANVIGSHLPTYTALQRERFGRIPISFATGRNAGETAEPGSVNSGLRTSDVDFLQRAIRRDRNTGVGSSADVAGMDTWQRSRALDGPSHTSATRDRDPHGGHINTAPHRTSEKKAAEDKDTWPVNVTITSIDYRKMTLTGTMEAINIPKNKPWRRDDSRAQTPAVTPGGISTEDRVITTFLEGEIIDLQQFTLETHAYGADSSVDSSYWRRLEPFKNLNKIDVAAGILSVKWLKETIGKQYVLMRWKEKCFVNPSEGSGDLTISGFYYISLNRGTGKIEGLYHDPSISPFQHLTLAPEMRQFSTYTFQ